MRLERHAARSQNTQAVPHAMEDNGGPRTRIGMPMQHRGAQALVDLCRIGRQCRPVGGDAVPQRFFIRAAQRSMVRGCNEMPNCDRTSETSARACSGPPSL